LTFDLTSPNFIDITGMGTIFTQGLTTAGITNLSFSFAEQFDGAARGTGTFYFNNFALLADGTVAPDGTPTPGLVVDELFSPEPASLGLLVLTGLVGLGRLRR
jgi:hypothetical protein